MKLQKKLLLPQTASAPGCQVSRFGMPPWIGMT
jgi:hypothetical protein